MTGFSAKVARLVFFERDGEHCFRCLRYLNWQERGFTWSMHHRRPRGMGGTKDPIVNLASNALTLCGHATTPKSCHEWAEKNRDEALDLGFLIPGSATTPEYRPTRVRVLHGARGWVRLDDTGGMVAA